MIDTSLRFHARVLACMALFVLAPRASAQEAPAQPAPPPPAAQAQPDAAPPSAGPVLEMPPEPSQPSAADDSGPLLQLGSAPDDDTLSRGLQDSRLAAPRTVVGGYGQFSLNAIKPGNANEFDAHATVRRVVLFVAHPITDDIRVYTEFEWEDALACASCAGSAEIEQALGGLEGIEDVAVIGLPDADPDGWQAAIGAVRPSIGGMSPEDAIRRIRDER